MRQAGDPNRYCDAFASEAEWGSHDSGGPPMREPFAAVEPFSAQRERAAPFLVHEGGAGMRAYFSTGVSTLVAIMAAHRIAAHEMTAKPAALQSEIHRQRLGARSSRSQLLLGF